ncbi:MAG: hypothetical protein KGL39_34605 [Patescibacteria group bacterium]|nr:hypothetical protein [Patescibacteria group bacterium]
MTRHDEHKDTNMRPMGVGKKPPTYDDPAVAWLMRLSKAALADCVIDLMRPSPDRESCDIPLTVREVSERLSVVLENRGDRLPE